MEWEIWQIIVYSGGRRETEEYPFVVLLPCVCFSLRKILEEFHCSAGKNVHSAGVRKNLSVTVLIRFRGCGLRTDSDHARRLPTFLSFYPKIFRFCSAKSVRLGTFGLRIGSDRAVNRPYPVFTYPDTDTTLLSTGGGAPQQVRYALDVDDVLCWVVLTV